jgi:hypothetical protein
VFKRDSRFRQRVLESAKRASLFKRKHSKLLRPPASPSQQKI